MSAKPAASLVLFFCRFGRLCSLGVFSLKDSAFDLRLFFFVGDRDLSRDSFCRGEGRKRGGSFGVIEEDGSECLDAFLGATRTRGGLTMALLARRRSRRSISPDESGK